jgi:hypothetical protein
MNFLPGSIYGIPIYYSDACLEQTKAPARRYKRRRWQTQSQAERVQKRWVKRFGFEMRPCIFKLPTGFIAHTSLRAKLESALSKEATIQSYKTPTNGAFLL